MTETEWTVKICKQLREKDHCQIRSLDGGRMGVDGWPDRLIVTERGAFLCEFKGPATRIQMNQLVELKHLHNLIPGHVFIVRKNALDLGGTFYHPVLWKLPILTFRQVDHFYTQLLAASEIVLGNDGLRRRRDAVEA